MLRRTSSSGPENRSATCAMPAVWTLISVRRAHHDQQHERGKRQRDAVLGRMRRCATQHRRAAQASRRHARHSGGTVWNSPQPGHSRSCGAVVADCVDAAASPACDQHRGEPIGELADRRADRRDLARDVRSSAAAR